MYFVKLEMLMLDDSVLHVGTSSTRDLNRASQQLEAYRNVAEGMVAGGFIQSYDLKMGTIPTVN